MEVCAVKDVDFHGAQLRAVQDSNNIIWVGVAYICAGIGFRKSQKDAQIQKIQHDKVLREGCLKFQAGVFDTNNETLALQLDYVPLWLCKINITDNMERFEPEIAARLREYQLRAKDVLAAAFLNGGGNSSINQLENQLAAMQARLEEIYTGMGNLVRYIVANQVPEVTAPVQPMLEVKQAPDPEPYVDETKAWRKDVYDLCRKVASQRPEFDGKSAVLSYIYKEMTRVYSVVWEQEMKEWKKSHSYPAKPRILQVIADNNQLRSIFQAMLEDLAQEEIRPMDEGLRLIQRLIMESGDQSIHGVATWRRVYKEMGRWNIRWNLYTTRYMSKYGTLRVPKKIELIQEYPRLMDVFTEAVKRLLENEK